MNFKTTLAIMLIIVAAIFCFTFLSEDSEARLCVWDGDDAGAHASTAANWDLDTAPVAGDDILFDGLNATGDDACTWDLATDSFGMFTIGAGYSGTITQSSDMHITGYSQAGGTFTGETTKWVYCNGSASSTSVITPGVSNFKLTLDGSTTSNLNCKILQISANVSGYVNSRGLLIDSGKTLTLTSDSNVFCYAGFYGVNNNGVIAGNKVLAIYVYDTSAIQNTNIGTATVLKLVILTADVSSARTLTITSNIICNSIEIKSSHAQTNALNLNGHSLTAATITVGTRGILDCGNGTITCSALTSTSGTIFEDTATWVFNSGAVVTATSGQKFYNVQMEGDCDFVSSVNVTNDLRFVDVPSEYDDLDVYLDTVYSVTIPSPYTFGPEITAAAEYTYIPDVQITISNWFEDVDFTFYAYLEGNLPGTWNITGEVSTWMQISEGRIYGIPPDVGNYSYTITLVHATGSLDSVSGYLIVGDIDTAEYSFDIILGLIFFIIITIFNFWGYYKRVPLLQVLSILMIIFSAIAMLRIPDFDGFNLLFVMANLIMFVLGMIRNYGG